MNAAGRIVLEGIGVVGGFGSGVPAFEKALVEGPPPPGFFAVNTGSGPVEVPAHLADLSFLSEFVPTRTLRRIDRFSRLGLLGSFLALRDADLPKEERNRLGLIVSSGLGATGITYAFLESFFRDGDVCASPTLFANSVHNSAAANISMIMEITGPCLTVSQRDISFPSALVAAVRWLDEERVDRVLLGAIEEFSPLIGYTWFRMRGGAKGAPMTPLRTAEETAIPGEGAAFLVLSREKTARRAYCTIQEAASGRRPGADAPVPEPGLLLLGADGSRKYGGRFTDLARGRSIACYSPIYGSMPAGPAFDLAAAALILAGGSVFPSPGGESVDFPATVVPGGEPPEAGQVHCLALGESGTYGLAALSTG
jgi:3-oxoacyl-[acyl-carrier-protein] synthase II